MKNLMYLSGLLARRSVWAAVLLLLVGAGQLAAQDDTDDLENAEFACDHAVATPWGNNVYTWTGSAGIGYHTHFLASGGAGTYLLPDGWQIEVTSVLSVGDPGEFEFEVTRNSAYVDDDVTIDGQKNEYLFTHGGTGDVLYFAVGTNTGETFKPHASADYCFAICLGGDDLYDGNSNTSALHVVFGGAGDDSITGGDVHDILFGDWFEEGAWDGADEILGGDAQDYIYSGADSGSTSDKLYGEAGNDVIHGGYGHQEVFGGPGIDSIAGGAGADILYGEAGHNYIWGDEHPDIVAGYDIAHPNKWGSAYDESDQVIGGNDGNYIHGGGGGDLLHGGSSGDELWGVDGDDYCWGYGGGDLLVGLDGIDRMWGGAGDDQLVGGNDGDFLYGEGDDDLLQAGDGEDYIEGGSGKDEIWGGAHDDEIMGGSGCDDIYGEGGDDDIWGGTGDDFVRGGDDDDTIYGEEGDDAIDGGAGDDILNGGIGRDYLHDSVNSNSSGPGNQLWGGYGDDYLHTHGNSTQDPDHLRGEDDQDHFFYDMGVDVLYDYDPVNDLDQRTAGHPPNYNPAAADPFYDYVFNTQEWWHANGHASARSC